MNQKELKVFFDKFNNSKLGNSGKFIFTQNRYVFFSPALFLMCLGIAVVLMPKFFLYFIAAFFITLGTLTFVLIWKLLQLKSKFEKLSKEFKGQVIVQGVRTENGKSGLQTIKSRQTSLFEEPRSGDLNLTDVTPIKESKKIIFH